MTFYISIPCTQLYLNNHHEADLEPTSWDSQTYRKSAVFKSNQNRWPAGMQGQHAKAIGHAGLDPCPHTEAQTLKEESQASPSHLHRAEHLSKSIPY